MSPLEKDFKGSLKGLSGKYPKYMAAAALILREMNMEIIPTERWNLEQITIKTFARCVAKLQIDESFFTALSSVGLTHMREVSHWFRDSSHFAGHPVCGIIKAVIDQDTFNIANSNEVDIKVPRKIFITKKIGPVRAETIVKIVETGIRNIVRDPRKELYIPREIRLTKEWQWNSVASVIKKNHNLVVSDGSKRQVAAFAVVDSDGKEVVSSPIVGRATSQRAEGFGLIAAAMNSKEVGADPKFILDAVSNLKKGKFKGTKILKVSNRSLIRKIAYLTDTREVALRWIRGHQDHREELDYILNRAADTHARESAAHFTLPLLKECWEWADDYALLWGGDLYEGDVRKKIYNLRINRMIEEMESTKVGIAFSRRGCWEEKADQRDIMKHNTMIFKMSTDTLPHGNGEKMAHAFRTLELSYVRS